MTTVQNEGVTPFVFPTVVVSTQSRGREVESVCRGNSRDWVGGGVELACSNPEREKDETFATEEILT
jgi:hypothetical protein